MQIDFDRTVLIDAPQAVSWAVVQDVSRVAGCIAQVSDLTPGDGEGVYVAQVIDRVGPFKITMAVTLAVTVDEADTRLDAQLSGFDRKTQTRVHGRLAARCAAVDDTHSEIAITADAQVLGPVATLGATAIRRRMDDIFAAFTTCLAGTVGG